MRDMTFREIFALQAVWGVPQPSMFFARQGLKYTIDDNWRVFVGGEPTVWNASLVKDILTCAKDHWHGHYVGLGPDGLKRDAWKMAHQVIADVQAI